MIRMALALRLAHYRLADGRAGGTGFTQRFVALNSWPDKVSLDKDAVALARFKKKYGKQGSAGRPDDPRRQNIGLRLKMGLKTFGFAFGRTDCVASGN